MNFSSTMSVIYLYNSSNAKSIMSTIMLEAGYGAEIERCLEDSDEEIVVRKLIEFVEQTFGEAE